ncbi:MAG: 8-amino-7-oxononanoate synthase [Firmicutes bacterium]|nr:8-amino-7-oxononanoate synthase [Bacillota bacterium]MCM1401173.1 8-amino-7-oxononanoate synthase [Bacteroides sp.]MCM1477130.1 8-amino-7-oxononanoate synthase [Bacteroides sp.]
MSYADTLTQLRANGNFRTIPKSGERESVVDFSQNDYLGLARREDLQRAFFANEANLRLGMSASASRLLASDQEEFEKLESLLETLYGNRRALLFNSGYHANTGLISALAAENGTLIVADKLVHASIIDGITLSKAPFTRFLHNDLMRLETILKREQNKYQCIWVVVESVYSMDGDRAPLAELIELKQRYPNVRLYIDEAHAFGVLGEKGLGLCNDLQNSDEVDVVVGTFGKAAASAGAFAIMNNTLRDYAVNRARSFIFSTALPPITCAWTRFMVGNITTMDKERELLGRYSRQLSRALGLPDARYIAPVIIGSARGAIEASQRLLEQGVKVLPIRTPTVPPGTERLRISLSAANTPKQIAMLIDALDEYSNSCPQLRMQ